MNWIKLTAESNKVQGKFGPNYINMDQMKNFYRKEESKTTFIFSTINESYFEVKETPEQIMKLLGRKK
jgi:hypothetical protein